MIETCAIDHNPVCIFKLRVTKEKAYLRRELKHEAKKFIHTFTLYLIQILAQLKRNYDFGNGDPFE